MPLCEQNERRGLKLGNSIIHAATLGELTGLGLHDLENSLRKAILS
jgi:hypothetical protein